MENDIVIFGAGGHSKVIVDIVEKQGTFNVKCLVDFSPKSTSLLGYPIISEYDFFKHPTSKAGVVAIGDNYIRSRIVNNILENIPEFQFITAVHPSAQVARGVTIGPGTCLMAHTTVNSGTDIGSHVIINTNSSVDHDCKLDDYTSVAPNSALGGGCIVNSFSAISIGATVIHGITINRNTIVGAGATVIKNLEPDSVYIGTPAKKISARTLGQKYL